MRVATLNRWGRSGAWADRRRVLIDGFAALRPDVVAPQETEVTAEEPRRIDYILVRAGSRGPSLEVADCRLLFDAPPWASLADLRPSG